MFIVKRMLLVFIVTFCFQIPAEEKSDPEEEMKSYPVCVRDFYGYTECFDMDLPKDYGDSYLGEYFRELLLNPNASIDPAKVQDMDELVLLMDLQQSRQKLDYQDRRKYDQYFRKEYQDFLRGNNNNHKHSHNHGNIYHRH
jgi:hypothetical protein